uniref:Integrase catalytic domain-containing protein n=1 Tax=Anabas testudineus TaxID=64144 RepID=A0A3Q1HLE4_ANATE
MSAGTVCTFFKGVLGEHGLPSSIIADRGTQYMAGEFRKRCEELNIALNFSSPYHRETNSIAQRAVGTVKASWKKAKEENKCPYTALWMYRIAPLDNNMASPYELLCVRKPRSILPTSKGALQRALGNKEQVYVTNTLKSTWEPGTVLYRPNTIRDAFLPNWYSKYSKTYTPMAELLCSRLDSPEATWGSVSCPRKLWHATDGARNQSYDYQTTSLPIEPQPTPQQAQCKINS